LDVLASADSSSKARRAAGIDWIGEVDREDVWAERMELELEARHDAEVAAAAADAPVQVFVLVRARDEDFAGRGHDLGRPDVVAGEPETPPEVSIATPERQATDSCQPPKGSSTNTGICRSVFAWYFA